MNRYKIIMTSDEFGAEEFKYKSLDLALEGLMRLAKDGIWEGDGVDRWFSLREIEIDSLEEEE